MRVKSPHAPLMAHLDSSKLFIECYGCWTFYFPILKRGKKDEDRLFSRACYARTGIVV